MADSEALLKAKIHYYCREKYFHAMQNAAVEGLKKFMGDPVYRFYFGISLVLEGRVQEGIRELDSVQDSRDVMVGSLLALVYAHRKCKVVDREAVSQLDAKLKEKRKQAGEMGLYYGGVFLFFTARYDKAKEYIDRMLKISPSSKEGLVLKGWLEVMASKGSPGKHILQLFEVAGSMDIDAVFGKAKFYEKNGSYILALELLGQAVARMHGFTPVLIEKMKMQLALGDWDQTLDSAHRALSQERQCLEAQRFLILHSICREGNYSQAASQLTDLIAAMDRNEPKNSVLFYETAQLFARTCGRNKLVLQHSYNLAERAANNDPSNADYATELGYQCLLQGKVKDALKFYRNATDLDEGSVSALLGVIFCQLIEGQLEVAGQQIELLKEIQKSTGMTSELSFLSGMLAQKQGKRTDEVLGYLNESVELHFSALETLPLGLTYFLYLNPDFLLLIVKLYMHYVPEQPVTVGQPQPPALKRGLTILQPVAKACSGLLEASYLTAKLKYLSGDTSAAQGILQKCLEHDAAFSDGRLLLAEIFLHQGNHQSANQALEVALSYSFEVRERPLFHLIKAKIQKKQGHFEEAAKTLLAAMTIAGLKPSSASSRKPKHHISTSDKVSLFLELADTYRQLDQQHEAAKIMQDAINEFQGTPEAMRITIANADLSLARGDVEQALGILRNVEPEQPYYLQAREKMANIYLHHRKDRRLYASCYRELVDKAPTPQSYLLLGDAYMNIQEPDRAIEVYEQALKKNPRDSMLARKIGQAYVKTHHYDKAVTYYKAAIKTGGQTVLRYDLAHLLFRMRRYRDAEDVIQGSLEGERHGNDLMWLQWEGKFLLLLSQVYLCTDKKDRAIEILERAREVQARVMRRISVEQPDVTEEQKKIAVSICKQLAEQALYKRDFSLAGQYYKEALNYDENNSELLLALAKLEMSINNLDAARQYCTLVLKNDKENDAATLMMADLMFRKTDLESAMFHFQQLLDRKPDYFPALARLIEATRRLGKLDELPAYLEKAEQYSTRSSMEAGYHYCKGLYEWYTGNTSGAVKSFNKARNDQEWGLMATYHMIEICVNPDNETLGGETFESVDSGISERLDSQEAASKTAEKLLNEIRPKVGSDLDFRIMKNFVLLSKKQKSDAELALNDFMDIAADERHRDQVGAILGMATAYMILKQTPKARNQLKRVAKNSWNFGDAEYLERCWLLLSDIYIQSGKYNMGVDLLRQVLQHNKSCTKAYEYMGFIMEKEQSYKDASQHYEVAWKQSNKANPVIGYKLAFNYMKAKRYVDAIDVSHAVLAKFPNYPKIRKDILEKSRSNLRA
ncbi:LOW QUALITY PROTEIN: tetratricopeptide repeat protein 21B-like [Tachypleus tridentatus]|uniref:LOW QUALITY PROTEIN: tetratricopeptide repeat protein 21B-like n=1 Tax=Tachypleus tridentatus TaxID=6853 RepID=UPI003FD5DA97